MAGAENQQVPGSLVQEEAAHNPAPYPSLPAVVARKVDEAAATLVDPDRGYVAVVGNQGSGKTFFVHQVVSHVAPMVLPTGENMLFVRLSGSDEAQVEAVGADAWAGKVCLENDCTEESLCVVTDNVNFAGMFTAGRSRVRLLVEVSAATMIKMIDLENEGATKMWGGWTFVNTDDMLMTKKEVVDLSCLLLKDKMRHTYGINLGSSLMGWLVDGVVGKVPDVADTQDGTLQVPLGPWLSAARSLCGLMALSGAPELRPRGRPLPSVAVEAVSETMSGEFEAWLDVEPVLGDDGTPSAASLRGSRTAVEFRGIDELEKHLKENVLGQDQAIDSILGTLAAPMAGLQRPDGPLASFLFCGPTGTGKTQTALSLARHLYKEEVPLVRIDMSELGEKHEVARLFGAPAGYTGFEQGGMLTNAVARSPMSVVLLDEIEKAHPEVWNVFLQVLHPGRMTDGSGSTVDFTRTVIIMTSNLGAEELSRKTLGFAGAHSESDSAARNHSAVLRAVEKAFRPELVNRLQNVVVFSNLSQETARRIVHKELKDLGSALKGRGFSLKPVPEDIVDTILEKADVHKYGAREVQRCVEQLVVKPVSYNLLRSRSRRRSIGLSLSDGSVNVSRA